LAIADPLLSMTLAHAPRGKRNEDDSRSRATRQKHRRAQAKNCAATKGGWMSEKSFPGGRGKVFFT